MYNNNNNKFNNLRNLFVGLLIGNVLSYTLFINTFDEFDIAQIKNEELNAIRTKLTSSTITYGRFLEYLDMGWIYQVDLYNNSQMAVIQLASPDLGDRAQSIKVNIPIGASQLIQKLKSYEINFDAHPNLPAKIIILAILNLGLTLIFAIGIFYLTQILEDKNLDNFTFNFKEPETNSNELAETEEKVFFDDIAGIDEALADFKEIVSYIRYPEKYTRLGARIPKGILLTGPPGTGKTLLAKAISSEANVPFLSAAGPEFVEMFVGLGAARIRYIFSRASQLAPCIIFIDEIDTIGRRRGPVGIGSGSEEREQTLNQLLAEMDGFKENKGVIVIGATNRANVLDEALVRPGRFDRTIVLSSPDPIGRFEILKIHAKDKPLAPDVSLLKIATRTVGFSGADLANLLNESAILATRNKETIISEARIIEAFERIVFGIEKPPIEDPSIRQLFAYYEVGIAMTGSILESHEKLDKITIIPRGKAKGMTWFEPYEGQFYSKRYLLSKIATIISGRVCERIVYGKTEQSTIGSGALRQATLIARDMVFKYGFSDLGPRAYNPYTLSPPYLFFADTEVNRIVKFCKYHAEKIILDNRVAIDFIVDELLSSKTLDGAEFRKLAGKFVDLPVEKVFIRYKR